MISVLGVLKTERGLLIKKEILENLPNHDFILVEQEPPGELFEYPAIKCAIEKAIELNEPILYLHTKGAFNEIPYIPNIQGRKSIDTFMPPNATLKDWQLCVRKMWYHEFGENINKYLNTVKGNNPVVACPYSGPGKATWLNGFIMNPAAAKELQKIFKFTTNRYWYEIMFNECDTVEVIGLINNNINYPQDDSRFEVYSSVWSFFN